MAQRAAAPKFGDWETQEDVAYTLYFEKEARGGSKGRKTANETINKANKVNSMPPPIQASSFNKGSKKEQVDKSKYENGGGSQKKKLTLTHSAIQHTVGRGTASSSHFLNHGGEFSTSHTNNKEPSAAADPNIEQPPPRPCDQEKVGGKGNAVSSLPPERKRSLQGTNGQAPKGSGRSQRRPSNRGKPDKVAAVPRFGDWDEKNPASADRFTHIFDKVIEERHEGSKNEPAHQTQTSVSSANNQDGNKNSEDCCCFPWKKKMFSWRRK